MNDIKNYYCDNCKKRNATNIPEHIPKCKKCKKHMKEINCGLNNKKGESK